MMNFTAEAQSQSAEKLREISLSSVVKSSNQQLGLSSKNSFKNNCIFEIKNNFEVVIFFVEI